MSTKKDNSDISATICGGCCEPIADQPHLVCSVENCHAAYHLEICCGPNPPTNKSGWRCQRCRCADRLSLSGKNDADLRDIRKSISNLTPDDKQHVTLWSTKKPNTPESHPEDLPPLDMMAIELSLLRKELTSVNDCLKTMSLSLKLCNERLDNVATTIADTDSRLKALEERDVEIARLKNKVSELQDQLGNQLQVSLKNEVEIAGIPEFKNESLTHIVKLTAAKTGVSVEDSDIDWVMRAGPKRSTETNKTPRPIVVRFVRRTKRDEMIKVAKSKKNLTTEGMNITNENQKIYINERLTRENRLLFRQARNQFAAAGFQFCWVQNGSVFIRRREGSAAIRLKSVSDLNEKLGSSTGNT
ncbi:hypothetical protein NE865_13584 [Phthorimaea operculella]|nr:hypothetical protein NE865_13584 [Phthorimaea operculella]